VFLFIGGYSLNRRVYAFYKVLLMCVFQFKRLSRCNPIYLTGVSFELNSTWCVQVFSYQESHLGAGSVQDTD
jgi:hypothetical protein